MAHLIFFMEYSYKFPIKINIVPITLRDGKIKVLMMKSKIEMSWTFPNLFFSKETNLGEALRNALLHFINKDSLINFKFINLETTFFDGIINISYLIVYNAKKIKLKYNTNYIDMNWFDEKEIKKKNIYDYKNFEKAIEKIKENIKKNPENIFKFLNKEFTLTELQEAFQIIGINKKSCKEKRNFRKWVFGYNDGNGFVNETNKVKYGNHRPAKLYKPNKNTSFTIQK